MNTSDQARFRAAKELRMRLGLSQSAFGRRIGRTLNTIVRYESQNEPRGAALLPYAVLAIQCGQCDLAETFRTAIIQDLGVDLERVMSWRPGDVTCEMQIPQDMHQLVEAFMEFMSAKDVQPAEELARSSLKQLLINEYSAAKLQSRRRDPERETPKLTSPADW